ncbi:hypothetical protein NQ318_005480 [Aromia moschata]|uniref:SLC26A/SulP transporter domain-containing protein n=1 Tax=Aromia moschata TaxID=1265417 RepID=A0AAV8XPB1_9CUCU|nr:hypothetical protein NQ318_005480 [Aromia moschata]
MRDYISRNCFNLPTGTFAIVCLMTGKVVAQYTTIEIMQNGTRRMLVPDDVTGHQHAYTNIEVATTVTFTVKDLLGLSTRKRRGNFSFILTVYDSILAVPKANTNVLVMSCVACIILTANNELLKPWLAKKTKNTVPNRASGVIIGTAVSYFMNLSTAYGVTVVGHIPTGFPEPALPAFELIPSILLDSFVITMVSYTITIGSESGTAGVGYQQHHGIVLLIDAYNGFLSRSMIQQTVGGVTQIASVVSCGILMVILLWIGPFFETLPRCVLASIIVVALKGCFFNSHPLLSKWDAIVWIVTFATTLFVQIGYGLAAGVAVSLLRSYFHFRTKPIEHNS